MIPTDHDVIEEMILTGGGFVNALGHAAAKADPVNLRRIKIAFPDYWETYAEHAVNRRKREDASTKI